MNRSDKKLIICLLLFLLLITIFLSVYDNQKLKVAYVYYEDDVILKVDLTKNEKQEFDVKGYNGNIHIVAEGGKIKVASENSKNNICSKQGYISSSNQVIVCLPNKVTIKIKGEEKVDTILR